MKPRPRTETEKYRAGAALMSQQEIANLFGASKTLIGQIEATALRKLRRHPLMIEIARDAGLITDEGK